MVTFYMLPSKTAPGLSYRRQSPFLRASSAHANTNCIASPAYLLITLSLPTAKSRSATHAESSICKRLICQHIQNHTLANAWGYSTDC